MTEPFTPEDYARMTPEARARLWSPAELLPQTGPMMLIDEVTAVTDEGASSRTVIRADCLLVRDGVFAPEGLIEIMAQTVGLFAGARSRAAGLTVGPGLLLGTRRLTFFRDGLRPGETVETEAAAVFSDESGLWQFRCRSSVGGEPAAEAILTLFSPPEDYFDQYRS